MASHQMLLTVTALLAFPTALLASPVLPRAVTSQVQGTLGVDTYWNYFDAGQDAYTMYNGNGSIAAGWPSVAMWVSFNDMWMNNQHVIQRSCSDYYNTSNNSGQEITDLYYAIKQVSQQTRVDHRFILAAVMQETKGCVRAATSTSPDGSVVNPGILQDFRGTHSCNENGKIQTPCPQAQILGMIQDGVAGTGDGHGFAEAINNQTDVTDIEFAQAYYRAARLYNSGMIDSSGDLGKGSATHCYASDIANRLTGWVEAKSACTLDSTNSTSS